MDEITFPNRQQRRAAQRLCGKRKPTPGRTFPAPLRAALVSRRDLSSPQLEYLASWGLQANRSTVRHLMRASKRAKTSPVDVLLLDGPQDSKQTQARRFTERGSHGRREGHGGAERLRATTMQRRSA